jgi:hypothetical protein
MVVLCAASVLEQTPCTFLVEKLLVIDNRTSASFLLIRLSGDTQAQGVALCLPSELTPMQN